VAPPPTVARNVVVPDQTGPGPERPQEPLAPDPPLAPLRRDGGQGTSQTDRPLFVDPPRPSEPGPLGIPSARPPRPAQSPPTTGPLSVPASADAFPTRIQQLVASPLLLAS